MTGKQSDGGVFSFMTSRPVRDEEGRELEALLQNWALRHDMRIGSYCYNVKE